MKKILSLVLAVLMVAFVFAACKKDNPDVPPEPDEGKIQEAEVANATYEENKASFFATVASQIAAEDVMNTTDAFTTSIDNLSKDLKNNIMSAFTVYDSSNISGTIYYVSNNGDDANDGKSPSKAWASIDKVNSSDIKAGDAVLFECGSLFRGSVKTDSGVTYASYGSGNKPIILQSKKNYAEGNLWTLDDASKNIWKLNSYVSDPGIMVFDGHTDSIDYVEEITATRIWDRTDDSGKQISTVPGYTQLENAKEDLTYYWGAKGVIAETFDGTDSSYVLYLKSQKDPNTFSSIEIGEDISVFHVGESSNVTIDGIVMKYAGGHFVKGRGDVNTGLTVKNCVIAYGGGSLIDSYSMKGVRYGNGIEIFGGCDGFTVQNNWIYQMFDTGITFQYHYGPRVETKMVNIDISNNLVEHCFWSLEWWISPDPGGATNAEVSNVHIYNNIVRYALDSWGTTQHQLPRKGTALSSSFTTSNLSNFVVENNIFDKANSPDSPLEADKNNNVCRLMEVNFSGVNAKIQYKNNVFVQYDGKIMMVSGGTTTLAKVGFVKKMPNKDKLEGNLFLIAPAID